MTKPTAVIAEDEIHLQNSLIRSLERLWPQLSIIGTAIDGDTALKLVEAHNPDVVFLDIQMPGLTGLEVARRIINPCRIVFITAFDQFAVKAFETEAVDYILKPISDDRLTKTIDRLKKSLEPDTREPDLKNQISKVLKVIESRYPGNYLNLVKVKTGNQIRFIPVSQILYFKASDKYTVVQTSAAEYLITTPIKTLEEQLDPDQFFRVHRNAVVNVHKIDRIQRSYTNQMLIRFQDNDHRVAVSRSHEHLFK